MDDFGLRRVGAHQSQDLYELTSSVTDAVASAFTSNRGGDAWLGLQLPRQAGTKAE
jgi:hypothetical protein